jgi:ABC-type branched-subunit amino acid transport system substrate-binding protein
MLFSCRKAGPGNGWARLFAIAALVGIAALAGCARPAPPPPPAPVAEAPPPPAPEEPAAPNALDKDQPSFLRLPNLAENTTPVRVGIILPLSSTNAATRALAQSLLKAAQLAMFDAANPNLVLIVEDDGNGGATAAAAARRLLAQGAEVIVGPLFAASVSAVAPVARDRGVPVLAFSTEKAVAGQGVYLISFLPENEVTRVVDYAAGHGHSKFAALVPRTPYGELVGDAMRDAVAQSKGETVAVTPFTPTAAGAVAPAREATSTGADALMIAQGGAVLRAMVPSIGNRDHLKLLGTGLWDDDALNREVALEGSWYAAPEPNADAAFIAKYRNAFGAAPAQLASLAYDAVALVALLAPGEAYHRFTKPNLMDPNGFAGVTGVFRFRPDGTSERGLAVLEMNRNGPRVVSPAPKTFQQARGS